MPKYDQLFIIVHAGDGGTRSNENDMTALRSEKTSTDLIILSMVKCCGTTLGSLSGRYKISVVVDACE